MKSPITGKEMKKKAEIRELTFRGEKFEIYYQYYLCEDSGEQFTTTELDDLNLEQLYSLYDENI